MPGICLFFHRLSLFFRGLTRHSHHISIRIRSIYAKQWYSLSRLTATSLMAHLVARYLLHLPGYARIRFFFRLIVAVFRIDQMFALLFRSAFARSRGAGSVFGSV
jgi:hypothetical protein